MADVSYFPLAISSGRTSQPRLHVSSWFGATGLIPNEGQSHGISECIQQTLLAVGVMETVPNTVPVGCWVLPLPTFF